MKKLLPVLLVLFGIGGGLAAGVFLKPTQQSSDQETADAPTKNEERTAAEAEKGSVTGGETSEDSAANQQRSYVKIGRQTIVPVIEGGKTRALMLFELAIDVAADTNDLVARMEPRLRDAFLRELLKMSYTGAFMSNFTNDAIIEELRGNLLSAARKHLGESVKDVLILDVMRQEK